MSTKYTPGPWSATQDLQMGDQVFVGTNEVLVAEVNTAERHRRKKPEDPHADARLIAAAPELLKCVERLHMTLDLLSRLRNPREILGKLGEQAAVQDAEALLYRLGRMADFDNKESKYAFVVELPHGGKS